MRRKHQAGLSLVELLVALAISAVLIFGATQVYVDSRNAYNVNENVARLQETARYAMSVVESDLRMANYWGLLKGATNIDAKASQAAAAAAVAARRRDQLLRHQFRGGPGAEPRGGQQHLPARRRPRRGVRCPERLGHGSGAHGRYADGAAGIDDSS